MSNVISQIFGVMNNQVLLPFYYGLIGMVAMIAVIVLIVYLIKGFVARSSGPEERSYGGIIKGCVIVLIILMIAAFAPTIVNWAISLGGGSMPGVNL